MKEFRLTLEGNKSSLNKQLGTLLTWFTVVVPGKEQRLLYWKMAKRNLKTWWETQGFEEHRHYKQSLMAHVCGITEAQSKGSLCRFQQNSLKEPIWSIVIRVLFMQILGQVETGLNAINELVLTWLFDKNEGDFRGTLVSIKPITHNYGK